MAVSAPPPFDGLLPYVALQFKDGMGGMRSHKSLKVSVPDDLASAQPFVSISLSQSDCQDALAALPTSRAVRRL